MKQLLFTLFLALATCSVFSQGHGEKLKALKVAFITERLELTQEEAQKFWPIYNAFEVRERQSHFGHFQEPSAVNYTTISEDQANTLIEDYIKTEKERHQNRLQFLQDIRKVLPAKKVLLLKKTEADFKREMLEQFKKRRQRKP